MQDIEYNRLRYVELKHGRISMRAVLDHIYYSLRRMYYLLLIGVLWYNQQRKQQTTLSRLRSLEENKIAQYVSGIMYYFLTTLLSVPLVSYIVEVQRGIVQV